MTTIASRPALHALVLCVAFAAVTIVAHRAVIVDGMHFDDAYIGYRYAVNIAEGHGPVYNADERVNGMSTPLYVFALAGFYGVGAHDLVRVSTVLGLAAALVTIVFSVRLGRALAGAAPTTFLFLLPVSISGAISVWAVTGMETMPYAALVTMFLWCVATGRTTLGNVLLVLCLLARFEAVLLLGAALAGELGTHGVRRWRRPAGLMAIGVAVIVGYAAVTLLYYGTMWPQTVALKNIDRYYNVGVLRQLTSLGYFAARNFFVISVLGIPWATLVVVLVLRDRRSSRPMGAADRDDGPVRTARITLAAFILLSLVSFVVGPRSDHHRYVVHLLPVLAVAASCAWMSTVAPRLPTAAWRRGVLAVLVVLAVVQALDNQRRMAQFSATIDAHQGVRKVLGQWIDRNVPVDEVVLSSDLGALSYYAKRHRFVDTRGRTSAVPLEAARHGTWDVFTRWLQETKPRWIADTRWLDGGIGAMTIITRPEVIYATVAPGTRIVLPEIEVRQALRSRDGREFVVGRLRWEGAR